MRFIDFGIFIPLSWGCGLSVRHRNPWEAKSAAGLECRKEGVSEDGGKKRKKNRFIAQEELLLEVREGVCWWAYDVPRYGSGKNVLVDCLDRQDRLHDR